VVLVVPVIFVVLFGMDLFQTIILSIVEGITEFLPISSTGHLILTSHLLSIPQTDFTKSFEIIIQLGAILAVVVLYWKRILDSKKLWKPLLVAFIPTAVIGLVLYKFVKNFLLGNTIITLLALFIGGIVLIIIEKWWEEGPTSLPATQGHSGSLTIEDLSMRQSFLIGLAQSVSIIPGVSRAAATIVGGLFMGMNRKTAVEFSFLLAIPTMGAATGLDLVKSGFSFTQSEWMMLGIGFIGAFVTALFAVKYFLKFIQNHTFIPFGIYRIILAVLFWIFIK
jgi:undecaprenyl-diphosphatase